MKNTKTLMYLFPDYTKSGSLKVFQDVTSQIRGYYFKKSSIKEVEKLDYVNNYAVYFLFEDSGDDPQVYIGQSENGISRIKSHVANKNFWNYCIMFVTDNNQFDKTCIDYLEWYFINLFKGTVYNLDNAQERVKKPNVDASFTEPSILNYAYQIEFLLEANGISLNVLDNTSDISTSKEYKSKGKFDGVLYIVDGKYVLKNGSVIRTANENTREYVDGGKFYERFTTKFNELVESGKAIEISDTEAKLVEDLVCNSSSYAGALCTGRATNGWEFWEGLEDEREK